MNPYETPNHTIEKSESELRIEKFENIYSNYMVSCIS